MQQLSTAERLEALIAERGDEIYRYCLGILRNHHSAQDATQEAFLRAYRGLSKFREDSSMRTWIMRIAINACRDQQRSAWWKRNIVVAEVPEIDAWPSDPRAQEIWLVVDALPAKQREAILLYYYHGFSSAEIGVMLHIPKGSVCSNLQRAREKMAKMLGGTAHE